MEVDELQATAKRLEADQERLAAEKARREALVLASE
jgi:hypothetical protein